VNAKLQLFCVASVVCLARYVLRQDPVSIGGLVK